MPVRRGLLCPVLGTATSPFCEPNCKCRLTASSTPHLLTARSFFHPPVGDHGDDGSLIVILCLDIDDERSDAVKFGALVSFQAIDSAGRYFIAVFDYTLI